MFNTYVFYLTVTKAVIFPKLNEINFYWKMPRNTTYAIHRVLPRTGYWQEMDNIEQSDNNHLKHLGFLGENVQQKIFIKIDE